MTILILKNHETLKSHAHFTSHYRNLFSTLIQNSLHSLSKYLIPFSNNNLKISTHELFFAAQLSANIFVILKNKEKHIIGR